MSIDTIKEYNKILEKNYSKNNPGLFFSIDSSKFISNFSQFYIKLYTSSSNFSKDINKDLSLDKKEEYLPFIKTL